MLRIVLAVLMVIPAGFTAAGQRNCATYEYLQQELKNNPSLQNTIDRIERFALIQRQKSPAVITPDQLAAMKGGDSSLPLITIPVVVHILYNTPAQNISDEQIQSQIDALNRDFRRLNADTVNTPEVFKHLAADCSIEFKLATVDPKGRATTGILRRQTGIQLFGLDDRIKQTAIGGDDPWDADQYLNIWIGNLAGGLLGYSNPLGTTKDKDGVVLHHGIVGTKGTVGAPYNKGHTASHEVGHWLGLRHIWGDEFCGNDYVDDTPPQRSPSFKCPTGIVITCNNEPYGNMYMNYMDLTYDACVNLFTIGQRDRMRSMFEPGGPRHTLLSSNGLGTPLPQPIELPVDSSGENSFNVFPNPAHNNLQVDVGSNEQLIGKTISLYTPQGNRVLQARITNKVMQLYIYQLTPGIYFLRIEGQHKSRKVIKQ